MAAPKLLHYDLTIPGWMTEAELKFIQDTVFEFRLTAVLEIGCLAGRSTYCWSRSLEALNGVNGSCMLSVDPWSAGRIKDEPWIDQGDIDPPFTPFELQLPTYAVWWRNAGHFANVKHLRIYSQDLDLFLEEHECFDLVFIDGDHSEDGINRDLATAKRYTRKLVMVHDYDHPHIPHLKPIVDKWAENNGYGLIHVPDTSFALMTPIVK